VRASRVGCVGVCSVACRGDTILSGFLESIQGSYGRVISPSFRRDGEDVVEHERQPFGRCQRLKDHQQRQPDRVGQRRLVLRVPTARALLTSNPQGVTDYLDADARDTDKILQAAAKTLDFGKPVALMLLGILNHILDDDEAHAIVNRLLDAVPSGSYLVIGHPTKEVHGEAMAEAMRLWNERGGTPITDRSRQELARFFDRLELLGPGVVSCSRWRPDPADSDPAEVPEFCAVGRKP